MKRTRWALALAGLAGLLALPAAAADSSPDQSASRTISVTGTGTVTSVPELSSWSFGASGRADTAAAAFASASTSMRALVAALKAAGVSPDDMQTQQISLEVQRSDDGTKTIGYVASSSVEVTVRTLERAGAVVDAAVGAGATDLSGPSFSVAGRDELYRRALAAAVDDATAKAKALAAAAGVTLGPASSLAEQSDGGPIAYGSDAARVRSGAMPIEPGQSRISASVTAVFAVT